MNFFKNASWTLLSASSHHSWIDHPSLKLYGRFSSLRGLWVDKLMAYARPFSSFANLKCSLHDLYFSCLAKCWVTKYQVVSTTRSSFHRSISSSQVSESAAFGKVPLPSCRRVMAFRCRISLDFAKVAGHVHILLGTLVRSCCRLFSLTILFPCRNLRERRQDLQARDFQCLSDLSSR